MWQERPGEIRLSVDAGLGVSDSQAVPPGRPWSAKLYQDSPLDNVEGLDIAPQRTDIPQEPCLTVTPSDAREPPRHSSPLPTKYEENTQGCTPYFVLALLPIPKEFAFPPTRPKRRKNEAARKRN